METTDPVQPVKALLAGTRSFRLSNGQGDVYVFIVNDEERRVGINQYSGSLLVNYSRFSLADARNMWRALAASGFIRE